jgi:hypothetical protein
MLYVSIRSMSSVSIPESDLNLKVYNIKGMLLNVIFQYILRHFLFYGFPLLEQ